MLTENFWSRYFTVYDRLNDLYPYRQLLDDLISVLKDVKGKKVLDVGGGTGNLSVKLAELGADVTCIDFSIFALEICAKKDSRIKTKIQDLSQDFSLEEKFDAILLNNVLYAIPKSRRVNLLRILVSHLRRPGMIVLSDPRLGSRQRNIFFSHCRKVFRKSGLLLGSYEIFRLAFVLINILAFNLKIKKTTAKDFFAFQDQRSLLVEAGLGDIEFWGYSYAGQNVISIGKKT